MKKSILNLGKALNKTEQKNINGNGPIPSLRVCECSTPGIPDFLPCDWKHRSIFCDGKIKIQ